MLPSDCFAQEVWQPYMQTLWPKIADCLHAKRVAKKSEINDDDFRSPNVQFVFPENVSGSQQWVKRIENGIEYNWNVCKSMFSVGNITEKMRIANFDCSNETVVDLYAGIGKQ